MAACEATDVVNNMVARGQHPETLFTWTIIGGPLNPSQTRYNKLGDICLDICFSHNTGRVLAGSKWRSIVVVS